MRVFLEAFVLGFSVAAPVGPIGLLCIRRTVQNGRTYGFATGFGAASADALYGVIAACGLAVVFTTFAATPFRLAAAIYVAYLGVQTIRAPVATTAAQVQRTGVARAAISTFAITVLNPQSVLSFAAMFAAIVSPNGQPQPAALVSGVFLGSMAWWLLLSVGIDKLRSHITSARLRYVNIAAGSALVVFAIIACWELWKYHRTWCRG